MDIDDVVEFDTIRKSKGQQYSSEEEERLALKGSNFIEDHASLAIWPLEQRPRRPDIIDINLNLKGGLIVKRASDTSTIEATKLVVDMDKLAHET